MDQNHPPKDTRSPVNLRIKFRSETLQQFIERYAIDVSRGGIFIRTREPLAVGTQLRLDFQYQNGAALMSGEGTVVWIRELDPNRANVPPGMGVRFDRLSPESQAVLEQLLEDKAKHDRSGVSPGGSERAGGGMAVRRPSSMFAALEPEQLSALPQPPPSSGGGGPGPGAATFPGRPSAAYIPTLSALAAQSPVKAATILSPAGTGLAPPPAQPRMTSSSMAAASSAGAKATPAPPPATSTTAKAPLSSSNATTPLSTVVASSSLSTDASASPSSAAGGAYRPLGNARNPFSTSSPAQKSQAQPATPAGASPRPTSTLSAFSRSAARPAPEPPGPAMTGPLLTDADLSGQDDDLTDEPTQIAGRMPSFMMADEDPTTVGPRPGTEKWFNSAKALDNLDRITAKDAEPPPRSPEAVFRALSGARDASPPLSEVRNSGNSGNSGLMEAFGSEAARSRQSLDLAPPLGGAQPAVPAEARNLRSTDDQLGTAIGSAALLAGGLGRLDPVASLDDPSSGPGLPGPTGSVGSAATLPPGTRAAARPGSRRPQPLIIGLTVFALGAAAFFVFKYFASQATTEATAGSTTAATITTAEPTKPSPEAVPSPTAAAAPAGEEAAKPATGSPAEAVAPSRAGAAEAAPAGPGAPPSPSPPPAGAAAPPAATGAEAAARTVTGAPSAPKAGAPGSPATPSAKKEKDTDKDVSPGASGSKTVAMADPATTAGTRKPVKRRPTRASGRETDSAPVATAAPDEPKAAPAEAPAPAPEAAAADAPEADTAKAAGHQIRVTSKPAGADVAIDGQVVGQTPLTTNIADVSAPHFLSVRKDGFEPFEQMISSTSAWAKGKAVKGQANVPTLKINAKLKAIGGGAGDAKSTTGDGAPAKDTTPATPKSDEPRVERPLAPSGEERAPVVP